MHTTIPFSALTQLFHGRTSEKPARVVLEHRERAREEEPGELLEVHHGADFLQAPLLDALMWSCPFATSPCPATTHRARVSLFLKNTAGPTKSGTQREWPKARSAHDFAQRDDRLARISLTGGVVHSADLVAMMERCSFPRDEYTQA